MLICIQCDKLKPKHTHTNMHTHQNTLVLKGEEGLSFEAKDFMFVIGPSVHYQTHKPTLSIHLFIPHLLIQPISSKFPLKQIKSHPHFLLKHFFGNSQFIVYNKHWVTTNHWHPSASKPHHTLLTSSCID